MKSKLMLGFLATACLGLLQSNAEAASFKGYVCQVEVAPAPAWYGLSDSVFIGGSSGYLRLRLSKRPDCVYRITYRGKTRLVPTYTGMIFTPHAVHPQNHPTYHARGKDLWVLFRALYEAQFKKQKVTAHECPGKTGCIGSIKFYH